MIRAFLLVAAVLVVVLAVVVDQPWLYGVAAAVLLGVLGTLARRFWNAYRQEEVENDRSDPAAGETSEEDLGVMEVRHPEEEDEGATETDAAPTDEDAVSEGEETGPPEWAAEAAQEDEETRMDWEEQDWEEQVASGGEQAEDETEQTSSPVYSDERPVLAPFLESLRASIGAQSVCLLVQEEVALEYRIEALASVQPDVKYEGTFETREPLLTATMSRQSVTVRSLNGDGRRDLGYYGTVPAITQAAVAPVSRPNTSSTVFLMADATSEVDLERSEARSLMEHFSDTVALLLDAREGRSDRPVQVAPEAGTEADPGDGATAEANPASASMEPAPDPREPDEETEAAEPRPRREIIAEEMEAADAASEDLALVLVHLNRAESIARQGEEAVATAERHLRSRLEDLAPGRRVERFGELTYGIFMRSGVDAVEGWAADLQDSMAKETGTLEGGVSVGVAVRDVRHDAESLRADATDALLEAYETGTCTIIA